MVSTDAREDGDNFAIIINGVARAVLSMTDCGGYSYDGKDGHDHACDDVFDDSATSL